MPSAFHDINAAQIFLKTEGAGAPVVLLHGFSLDQRMWDDQAIALAEHFRVLRYDLRGYGRSSSPGTRPYSHADDLHALLLSLRASPAHVVGLSLGGRIAARFALAYPDAVRSLTLVDAALDGHAWSAQWLALWNTIACAARSGDLESARRLWLAHPLFGPAHEQPVVMARLSDMVRDYSGWHWLHPDPGTASGLPAIGRLGDIQRPTLVVLGQRDLGDFHRISDTLASGIPGATRVGIPGAGHMSNMEAPAAFNRVLLDFLLAQDPAGSGAPQDFSSR
jgi:pimeloyl-ACP methyl ester carboxylesterase